MCAPYSISAIANKFIALYARDAELTPIKLQKLLYLTYGHWLIENGGERGPLTEESPVFWSQGPLFSSIRKVLGEDKTDPIAAPIRPDPLSPPPFIKDDAGLDRLVRTIWDRYGELSAEDLVVLTTAENSAWYRAAEAADFQVEPRPRSLTPGSERASASPKDKRLLLLSPGL